MCSVVQLDNLKWIGMCCIPSGWFEFNQYVLGLRQRTSNQRFNGEQRVQSQLHARMRQWVIHYTVHYSTTCQCITVKCNACNAM